MSDPNNEHVDLTISFQSNEDIISVGKKISDLLSGGAEFVGLDECIHEEIPCIYIPKPVLGFTICLDGYKGYNKDKNEWYSLYFEHGASVDPLLRQEPAIRNSVRSNAFREYLKMLISQIPDFNLID